MSINLSHAEHTYNLHVIPELDDLSRGPSMALIGKNVLITGASMGIGAAIARAAAEESANLILFARSEDKLIALAQEINGAYPESRIWCYVVDVQAPESIAEAMDSIREELGPRGGIDVLVNNAGLALGAPAKFHDQTLADIDTMAGTNINGFMYMTHAVLNAGGMAKRGAGTILNITSTTGLEVPPFPGEAVYHMSKAAQEAFTNVLRTELGDTNIKVLALRPGIVATNFHELRVGYEKKKYDEFMRGIEPLKPEDVADAAIAMLTHDERVSITALNVQPTAQRSLNTIDRNWNKRHGKK